MDELPTLKRAHRKVLQASSAVNVRMRTLALALNTTDSLSNSDILHSGNLDNTSGPGLTLSVEVQNPSETGLGFEIQSITVELDSVQTAKVGMTKCIKQPVFAPDFPLVLDCVSQHHFLFSLQLNDVFFDQSNVGVEEPTKELPPPTPIAAMVSPAQSLSRRHQHNVAQTSTVDASLSASQQTAGDLRQKSAFDQRKTACIVVRGRPVRRPDPYLPENSSFQPYITEVFESRWNCALDVSTLARARTEQQSTRTRAGHSRSSIRSHGQAYAPSKPENIAGDKRFTHSSLSSVSSGLADIEFDRRASLPPSISAIENMANVPFTGYSEESHHLRSLFSPQSPIDTTTAKPSPQNNDSSFEGDSLTPGFRYPIPGHPTYTEHRQDATAGPAIHPTESMAPTEKVFYRKPGAAAANMGSGLLIHVSLLSLHSQPGDPAAPFTLNAKTTSRPQSAVKQPSLGRVSSESDQSSGPDATPEEEAAGQEADDNRKRSHVRLFDTFVLEVFIMNKTSTARMFTVGVPPKRLGEEGKRGPSTEGGRGLPLHNSSFCSYLTCATDSLTRSADDISTEVGVVALEDEVLVG